MFTAEIRFRVLEKAKGEVVADAVDGLIVALQRNGQVLSDEWPIAAGRSAVRVYVSVPERISLQRNHENKWVAKRRDELAKAGLSQASYTVLGREPEARNPCPCKRPSAFILFTHYLSMESPLRCAECFGPVPFYRIPHTSDCGTYEDVIFWRRNYQRCDELQMGCTVGERFGTRQMSSLDSELSKTGTECCRRVTEVSKRPCYYYLYRYRGQRRKQEAKRRCPSCNGRWRLQGSWHEQFDYRCDRCHLLSNLANCVI